MKRSWHCPFLYPSLSFLCSSSCITKQQMEQHTTCLLHILFPRHELGSSCLCAWWAGCVMVITGLKQVKTSCKSKQRRGTSTLLAPPLLGSRCKASAWHTFDTVLACETKSKAAKEDNRSSSHTRPHQCYVLCFPVPPLLVPQMEDVTLRLYQIHGLLPSSLKLTSDPPPNLIKPLLKDPVPPFHFWCSLLWHEPPELTWRTRLLCLIKQCKTARGQSWARTPREIPRAIESVAEHLANVVEHLLHVLVAFKYYCSAFQCYSISVEDSWMPIQAPGS